MRCTLLMILLASLSACETLAPQAREIKIVSAAAAVANCHAVGSVHVSPLALPGTELTLMRNQAVPMGADTILLTSRLIATDGTAYRCKP